MKIFKKNNDTSQQVKDFRAAEAEKRRSITQQTFIGNLRTMSVSILAITLAMVIDGIIIGQFLGTDAIAGYGLASPIFMIINAIFAVFGTGAQSVCANFMGRGDMKKANGIFNATLIATLALSALMTLVLIIALDPLAQMLCATNSGDNAEALVQGTKDYILGITVGIPIQFLCRVISPFMQLDSDRQRVLPSTLSGSGINIAGDLFNALVLNWGLFGMALASSVGFCGELTILLLHFRKKTAMYKINFKLSS